MSALSFAEIEGLHVEALPARTVLSVADVIDLGGGDAITGDGGSAEATNTKGDVMQSTGSGDATAGDGAVKGILANTVK